MSASLRVATNRNPPWAGDSRTRYEKYFFSTKNSKNFMKFVDGQKEFKKKIEPLLEEYFFQKLQKVEKIDPLAVGAVKEIQRLVLSGGKRIRPALVYFGFLIAGGKDSLAILKASLSIELIHAFLLIHDDVIDRDEKRHSSNTVNKNYQLWGEKLFLDEKESSHFGNSMAIVVGDMAYSMANEILFDSDFAPETILVALKKIQDIVYRTIPGEMLDILLDAKGTATEEEIMKMYDGKTARYTFEGPLHLGACLAGQDANKNLLKTFSDYAIPAGQAFQLQDDILGIFGDEKKMGKPVGSDISEGKQTLLIVKALEKGNKKEKEIIQKYLSQKNLSSIQLQEFRQVIQETGALKYAQEVSESLVKKALEALEKMKKTDGQKEKGLGFLKDLAEYTILRQV